MPLRITLGAGLSVLYANVSGHSLLWLHAMAMQLCSYCISVCIDLRFRNIVRRRRAQEALALKQARALAEQAAISSQVSGGRCSKAPWANRSLCDAE